MELTEKQKQGLAIAIDRYKRDEKATVIAGYAGTGKSTLIKFIIAALRAEGIKEDDVVYTSFTGKAAQVLRKKGNKNAITLHKLLYQHIPLPDGGFAKKLKTELEYKVVVVDECSMVPKALLQILANFPVYIICLGDSGQLPPIYKDEDNHLLDNPHIFLDEIMRQAAESEIIQLTMKIRNNVPLQRFIGKEVQVLERKELTPDMLLWADQIICAKNETRIKINNKIRELLGKGPEPEDGDKVICLHNYWDELDFNEDTPLVNGEVGYIKNVSDVKIKIPSFISNNRINHVDCTLADFCSNLEDESDGVCFSRLYMDKQTFSQNEQTLKSSEEYLIKKMNNSKKNRFKKIPIPYIMTYGYAITGWKAQGSQWDKVLVIEEDFPHNKEEHKQFLYTCATRAVKKLVIIKK